MDTIETAPAESLHRNEDPLTHESGSHPVSTGVGATGGGATGAAIGAVLGGPVGGVIGALVGVIAGGLGGSAVGEAINPTQENEAWPGQHADLQQQAEASEHQPDADPGLLVSRGTLEEETEARSHVVPSPGAIDPEASQHEQIALRAWSYYEASGYTDGHDLEDWLLAEQDVKSGAV